MPDIEVSEKAVVTVEAENDRGIWVPVPDGQFIGLKEDVAQQGEDVKQAWIAKGWPESKIRVSTSGFRKQRNVHTFEAAKQDTDES